MTVFTTARLGLNWNYQPGDTGWGASFNLAMREIDTLLGAYLLSDSITAPPGSPADADAYFLSGTPSGAWVGQVNKIAAYQGGVWQFYAIPKGLRAFIVSRSGFYYWTGTAWTAEPSGSGSGGVLTVAGQAPDGTGNVALVVGNVSGAAPLSSPTFTGTPSVPNVAALDRSGKVANTLYVDSAVSAAVVGGFASTDLSGLPTSNPGGGKPWLNGGVLQVGA